MATIEWSINYKSRNKESQTNATTQFRLLLFPGFTNPNLLGSLFSRGVLASFKVSLYLVCENQTVSAHINLYKQFLQLLQVDFFFCFCRLARRGTIRRRNSRRCWRQFVIKNLFMSLEFILLHMYCNWQNAHSLFYPNLLFPHLNFLCLIILRIQISPEFDSGFLL